MAIFPRVKNALNSVLKRNQISDITLGEIDDLIRMSNFDQEENVRQLLIDFFEYSSIRDNEINDPDELKELVDGLIGVFANENLNISDSLFEKISRAYDQLVDNIGISMLNDDQERIVNLMVSNLKTTIARVGNHLDIINKQHEDEELREAGKSLDIGKLKQESSEIIDNILNPDIKTDNDRDALTRVYLLAREIDEHVPEEVYSAYLNSQQFRDDIDSLVVMLSQDQHIFKDNENIRHSIYHILENIESTIIKSMNDDIRIKFRRAIDAFTYYFSPENKKRKPLLATVEFIEKKGRETIIDHLNKAIPIEDSLFLRVRESFIRLDIYLHEVKNQHPASVYAAYVNSPQFSKDLETLINALLQHKEYFESDNQDKINKILIDLVALITETDQPAANKLEEARKQAMGEGEVKKAE